MQVDQRPTQMKSEAQDAEATDGQVAPSVSGVVGETLRTWRQEAGLSIREVAERSGLSVSFISLVERGKTEIAFIRLIRLADVFGRQASDVLARVNGDEREESGPDATGHRREAKVYGLAKGVEIVYLGEPEWATQPFLITLQPGAVHGPIMHSYKELVVCLDGEGTIVGDKERSTLAARDIVNLEANTYHAYMNTSSSTCQLLAVDFRTDDVRVLLATWEQVGRSKRSSEEANGGPGLLQDRASGRQDLKTAD
jgi:XRE family transcriptional regulator, regulator of sulfur utilization